MKISKKISVILMILVLLTIFALPAFAKGQDEKPFIPVVSKGEQHDFWQQVKLGANAAADKLGVDITFEGPASESDVQDQVEMLNSAMAKNPVAIALAALNTESVLDQLAELKSKGIPVIGFDSGVPNAPPGVIYANASTDNFNAAGLAAEEMFKVISGDIDKATAANPVTIVVMNQDAAGESLLSRGKGFRDTMVDLIISKTSLGAGDIKVMGNTAFIDSKNPTGGNKVFIYMVVPASASATDSAAASTAVLNKVKDENILGIFCSNEGTVKGLLAATNDGADFATKYKGLVAIGFDAGAAQKNAVREGFFLGSITQDPYRIGYLAVELAYKAYKGESVSDVDTGAKFYDKGNMENADIRGLLYD